MTFKWIKANPVIMEIFAFNQEYRDRWVVKQASKLPAGSMVLDVGAGSCPYRSVFAHCQYKTQDIVGLDPAQLRNGLYGDIDFVGDAAEIAAPNASFDAVLCTEVLEHHPEPIRVIKEISRLLRPGGTVIITAPLGSGIHQEPYHFYGGYTPFWYQRFLTEFGFDSIEITPNRGFFSHFGQESMRFIALSNPWRLDAAFWQRIIWAPFWLLMWPFFSLVIPLLSVLIDSWDKERRFTIGYHVTAQRNA